jgi:hypothetical protein
MKEEMTKENRLTVMLNKILKGRDQPTRHQTLQVIENDNTLMVGARREDDNNRDRFTWDRDELLDECLNAWRFNPLARRIVELTSQYVVGSGLSLNSLHAPTHDFIQAFWQERLNHMDVRAIEMCDELTRSGNLFILLTTDPAGMSYLRIVPASNIASIESAPNDIEQGKRFISQGEDPSGEALVYEAYERSRDGLSADGHYTPVMLHYAINRPAGAQWGEPDLAPLLRWLGRYTAWLEDRVRLNRFRNAFLYVIKAKFINESARRTRQLELAANPPAPGSILVTDESEEWSVISPKLEALDASTDGLAIKKMIAAGAGVPLHFLAEPESSTRTTAEAAGGPTYRRFEQRQHFFTWMMADLLKVVVMRRSLVDPRVDPQALVTVKGADISARDNVALSMAAVNVGSLTEKLADMGLIGQEEMLRVIYRFLGEPVDIAEVLKGGSGVDRREVVAGSTAKGSKSRVKVDPETGELKPITGNLA